MAQNHTSFFATFIQIEVTNTHSEQSLTHSLFDVPLSTHHCGCN